MLCSERCTSGFFSPCLVEIGGHSVLSTHPHIRACVLSDMSGFCLSYALVTRLGEITLLKVWPEETKGWQFCNIASGSKNRVAVIIRKESHFLERIKQYLTSAAFWNSNLSYLNGNCNILKYKTLISAACWKKRLICMVFEASWSSDLSCARYLQHFDAEIPQMHRNSSSCWVAGVYINCLEVEAIGGRAQRLPYGVWPHIAVNQSYLSFAHHVCIVCNI